MGKKTREGEFGACLDVREKDGQLLVYSARPGGRLWEVSISIGGAWLTTPTDPGRPRGGCAVDDQNERTLHHTPLSHPRARVGNHVTVM